MMGLEEIVEELAPRLLRYCLGSCRDAGTAQDVAQEGLTALVQRWRRHGPPDSPEAFVFTIASRRLARAKRRWRRFAQLEETRPPIDPRPDPERVAGGRDELGHILRGLDVLPAAEREALLLASAAELPLADIAAITGVSLAAVKMRVHRARRRLADALGRGDHE